MEHRASQNMALLKAMVLGRPFDHTFDNPDFLFERLHVQLRGTTYEFSIDLRSVDQRVKQEITELCTKLVQKARAERALLNPSETAAFETKISFRMGGTLEQKREATGMSLTAFANVFRKIGKPAGTFLPVVVHSWAGSPTLHSTLKELLQGEYPVDDIRRKATHYNVLVDHVSSWQQANKNVDSSDMTAQLERDRSKMIELRNAILEQDQKLVAALKGHIANLKDMSPRILELYENARERIAQAAPRALDQRNATKSAFSTMPILTPRSETMATCACSLADLGESLRDKTVGA
jgi:hypothetical protein